MTESIIKSGQNPIISNADCIFVKSGEDTIRIDKAKIIPIEWKLNEGVINLVYQEDCGNIVSVQVDEQKDPDGFTAVLDYIKVLNGGYSTEFTGAELNSEEIKQMYPDFNPDDVEGFAIYLSLKKRRFKVYQHLADA
ncbi:MAG: hypothetical protein WBV73_10990 [Phormidium sp.]